METDTSTMGCFPFNQKFWFAFLEITSGDWKSIKIFLGNFLPGMFVPFNCDLEISRIFVYNGSCFGNFNNYIDPVSTFSKFLVKIEGP